MNVGLRRLRKALKKILHQLHLKVADSCRRDLSFHNTTRAAAEVDGGGRERFIHRHEEIARAQNPALRAKRFLDRRAQRNAHIFHRVMLIHVQVATRIHFQIKSSMPGNQIEHVIEESDSRCDAGLSTAIQIQFQPDIRLARFSMDCCHARHVQSVLAVPVRTGLHSFRMTLSSWRISAAVPMVMRTNPPPMSLLRSRSKMPFSSSLRQSAGPASPKSANKKLPALG